MTRSLGHKPHNDITRGRYEPHRTIDSRTFHNHREGRLSYHDYREQHWRDNYDDEINRNRYSTESNDMMKSNNNSKISGSKFTGWGSENKGATGWGSNTLKPNMGWAMPQKFLFQIC